MAEENKIIRLADVGELEADLKKDLAEEEAKGKTADILYCESISDELSDEIADIAGEKLDRWRSRLLARPWAKKIEVGEGKEDS